ncbi:glycoside hydrolase family 99-like domain-containing protein [Lysobacter tyrosinilyticus]
MSSTAPTRLRSALFRALRAAFRALPIDEARRDAWRQHFLARFPSIRPATARGIAGMTGGRRPYVHAGGRALGYVEHRIGALPDPLPATLVAFYLPQFHAIPENDAWWGKGFTEWRNVTRALPQFEGHAQPRLPGDLGFYDLRNPQVMRDQAKLAREYGIGAFCFYFYWFGGKTLLEAPLQQWLDDPSIEQPFCLCWANENWSRRWDGRADDVLIAQAHDADDDLAFIAHATRYLRDPRYLRHEGKPLLLVYRPGLLPDAAATAKRWRAWCRDNGVGEIHLAYVQSFDSVNPAQIGFDAAVEFPPNLSTPPSLSAQQRLINPDFDGDVVDWRELARDYESRSLPAYPLFPGVNCGWDNEPRRAGRGRVLAHASPHRYGQWLRRTITERLGATAPDRRLVFINAWNEWAEGAVLEPDARLGHAWLQATRDALIAATHAPSAMQQRVCVIVHAWYPDTFGEILEALSRSGIAYRLVVTTAPEKVDAIRSILARSGIAAEIEVGENRGRDVLPFIRAATRLRAEGEDVLLKLHTKQSPHVADGARWRQELVHGLLGDAHSVLEAFASDGHLGLVAVEAHHPSLAQTWGANEDTMRSLAARLGIREPDAARDRFPSGTMFWTRSAALSPLLDAHLAESDFEAEAGQIDGTLAHAIERMVGICVDAAGFRTMTRPDQH